MLRNGRGGDPACYLSRQPFTLPTTKIYEGRLVGPKRPQDFAAGSEDWALGFDCNSGPSGTAAARGTG